MKKQLALCIAILLITTGMMIAPARFGSGQVVIDPGQTVQLAHGLGDLPAFTDCLVVSGNTESPDIMFVPCDQSPYAIEMRIDYRYINVYNPHEFSVTVRINAER